MELSNVILTGWGTETLAPEVLQKIGINDAAMPLEVAFAKAVFNHTSWVMPLGLCKDIGKPELAGALRAIQLGQFVRKELNLAANRPIANACPAAVVSARRIDPTVGWLPETQLAALTAICLSSRAPVIVTEAVMRPATPACPALHAAPESETDLPAQLLINELRSLLRRNDPLAVFVSLLVRNDQDWINMLDNAQAGKANARLLPLVDGYLLDWPLAELLVKDSQCSAERQPDATLKEISLDALAWRQAYPALAAVWGRLDAIEQQVAAGAAVGPLAMGLVRKLDLEGLACLGVLPRPQGVPLYPASPSLLAHVQEIILSMDLGANAEGFFNGHKRETAPHAWRQIGTWLDLGDFDSLMQFAQPDRKDGSAQQLAAQMLGLEKPRFKSVPLFPLTEAEKTVVQAHIGRQDAFRQLLRAEKKRSKVHAEERAREAFRQQEAQKLAALAALTPGRRAIAILKDETYWRGRWQELDPEWQNGAEALKAQRLGRAAERTAAREAARQEKLMAQAVPSSRYLEVTETPQGVVIRFDPQPNLTLGSASLGSDMIQIARRRLGKGQLKHPDGHKEIFLTQWDAPRLEALVARDEMQKLERALGDIDAEIQTALSQPLAPYHVEQILKITKAERLRWTKAGRLTVIGTDTCKKGRIWIEYPLFSRTAISAISTDMISQWRAEDHAATARKRKAGATRAVATRKRNAELREEEQTRIDQLARDAARTLGDLTAVSLVKLAIYAQLASRWAKRFQVLGRASDSQHFYDLKDKALRVIAASPHAKIAYVPSEQAKYHVELCEYHYDEWREFRRYDRYVRFWDWVDMESDRLKKCGACDFAADHTYWALYLVELTAGDLRLSFHVPHAIGIHYLPHPKHLDKRPDESSEGMFRYGRPVDEEEMLLHPAPQVEAAIEALLRLFKATEETGTEASRLPG